MPAMMQDKHAMMRRHGRLGHSELQMAVNFLKQIPCRRCNLCIGGWLTVWQVWDNAAWMSIFVRSLCSLIQTNQTHTYTNQIQVSDKETESNNTQPHTLSLKQDIQLGLPRGWWIQSPQARASIQNSLNSLKKFTVFCIRFGNASITYLC